MFRQAVIAGFVASLALLPAVADATSRGEHGRDNDRGQSYGKHNDKHDGYKNDKDDDRRNHKDDDRRNHKDDDRRDHKDDRHSNNKDHGGKDHGGRGGHGGGMPGGGIGGGGGNGGHGGGPTVQTSEPAVLLVLGAGLLGAYVLRRRK